MIFLVFYFEYKHQLLSTFKLHRLLTRYDAREVEILTYWIFLILFYRSYLEITLKKPINLLHILLFYHLDWNDQIFYILMKRIHFYLKLFGWWKIDLRTVIMVICCVLRTDLIKWIARSQTNERRKLILIVYQ